MIKTKKSTTKKKTGCKIHNAGYRTKNQKSEYRNPKWFGQLTILSQVEGQIQNTNFKGSRQKNSNYPTLNGKHI